MSSDEAQAAYRRAQAVRQMHEGELLRLTNVVGVGIGLRQRGGRRTSEVALVVMVQRKVPAESLAPGQRIPSEIEGVPVDVQVVGRIEAQGAASA